MSEKNPSNELFEMFQRMVNPMAFPLQGLLMGALSVEEIDKKIAELVAVKHWLSTNLGMLELTIKTLEYQKAILASGPAEGSAGGAKTENPLANPALWPWNFLNPAAQRDPGAGDTPPKKSSSKKS